MNRDQERKLVSRALFVSFGFTVLLAVLGFFLGEGWSLLVCSGSLFVLALGGFQLLCRAGLPTRWMLGLAILNVITLAPEQGLRLVGFYQGPRMEFGYPDPHTIQVFDLDPELFWINSPNSPGFNSLGFRGDDFAIPKPDGVYRVLFLGDSCTAIGRPNNYPMIVGELLGKRDDGRTYEIVNLAVPGYSSHQGRVLAGRYAATIGADVVLVYFGWNDHWQAYGQIDRAKRVPAPAEGAALFVQNLRMVHALRWVRASLTPPQGPLDSTRVPEEQYRENLNAIVESFRALDTPVFFITAPSSFYRKGVPVPLVDRGFLPNKAAGLERHTKYLAMTREAATLEGAHLLDLASWLEELENPDPLLQEDGIHYTGAGRQRVAAEIVRELGEFLDGK